MKDSTVKATIKKLGINGEGIAYLDKKITFIQGALPTEEVLAEMTHTEPRYKIGVLKKIIKPASCRVPAKCRYQKDCLSCPLMIMDYTTQLTNKYQLVKDTFAKYVGDGFSATVLHEIMPASQQFGIRQIVRLPIVSFDGRLAFGIYQRESKFLTLMADCPMQSKRINQCLAKLERIMNDLHLHSYDDVKKKGLRFLTVRAFDEGLQLIFVTGTDRLPERAVSLMSQIEGVKSILLTVNTSRKQDFDATRYECCYGNRKGTMEQIFMQKKFQVSSKADFPVYRQHALHLAKTIASLIPDEVGKIIELGSGIGLYSLGLDAHYTIHGIDTQKVNVMDANRNAALQKRENAIFEDGRIESLFTMLSKRQHFDMALIHLDGFKMDEALLDSLRASKIPYLLIDSEHLSTMAKQVSALCRIYELKQLVPLDSHPNGPGMCTVALMKRK